MSGKKEKKYCTQSFNPFYSRVVGRQLENNGSTGRLMVIAQLLENITNPVNRRKYKELCTLS
jgi:hypothetical protein